MKPPQVLSGFHDILPQEMVQRNSIISQFKTIFESHGFEPIETPSLEYYSTLAGKEGGESEMLMYDFTDHGDRHVGLIYDLTVPIARVMATYQSIPKPFKRYQIQRVWRAEKPQKGRYREFCQCDFDVFGSRTSMTDALIVAVLSNCISKIGFERSHVVVNHRQILEGIMRVLDVPRSVRKEAVIIIDKLDKIGKEWVENELEKLGVNNAIALTSAITIQGNQNNVFSELRSILKNDDEALNAIENINEVLTIAVDLGAKVEFSPSLARGQSYYTGPVFECQLDDIKFASLGGGGRYDNLIGIFSGQQIPASGASLGIDRIISAMKEIGIIEQSKTNVQISILHFGAKTQELAIMASNLLISMGFNVDLFVGEGDLSRQLKYASKKGVAKVIIIGEDEVKSGKVSLKNMITGDQKTCDLRDVASMI